ncbi:MAG TPA: DUF883 family protein [Gallionella sp.]|nr:DUF883 family protein [Gallionella sp.]
MSAKSAGAESEASKEKLMQDFRMVMADAEELLRATAGQAGEKTAAARARIQENLATAKARLTEAESELIGEAKHAAKATDEYVHDNPWKAIGVAASVGVIVGMLIGRGR